MQSFDPRHRRVESPAARHYQMSKGGKETADVNDKSDQKDEEPSISGEYARWFRGSTPYIHTHRDKTFVVLLPGEACGEETLINIVHDLALLSVLGIRLIVVHGARPQIASALPASEVVENRRVTSADDMDTIISIAGRVRSRIEALFSMGLPNTPLHNVGVRVAGGNIVRAQPVGIKNGIDHQQTGEVRSIDKAQLDALLDARAIVLLSPIGYSPSGVTYNLEASELAARLSVTCGADKLIAFDEDGYVRSSGNEPLRDLTPAQLVAALPDNDERALLLGALLRAVRGGVSKAHLVSFARDGALLEELFTAGGGGSQVSESEHRVVRPATPADLSGISELVRPLAESGSLIARSPDQIERDLHQYLVAVVDGVVVGCCTLLPCGDDLELASVAVHDSQRGDRITGSALLRSAEDSARASGATRLWALTTAARDWFVDRGFKPVSADDLPQPRKSSYDGGRNSAVLCKVL